MRLRGLPAVGGRGSVGGAIRGTLPHVQALKLDLPIIRSLAVLVRDELDRTSPGAQPELALLEAEEATDVIAFKARMRFG